MRMARVAEVFRPAAGRLSEADRKRLAELLARLASELSS
jgi:hypothetical protein